MTNRTDTERLRELLDPVNNLGKGVKAFIRSSCISDDLDPREVPAAPSIDLGNADYLIALDDSGGIEPLINSKTQFVPGTHPISVIAAFGVHVSDLPSFNFDWNELRTQIKKELNAPFLPPIHMRHMFGRSLPPKLEGHINPYTSANFESQIVSWLEYARFTMSHYSRTDFGVIEKMAVGERRDLHSTFIKFINRTRLWKDLRYLRATRKKNYEFVLSRLSNPLPRILCFQIGLLNHILSAMDKTAVLVVDNFEASQGVASASVHQLVHRFGCSQITGIYRSQRMSDVPLLQAADVFAWYVNRIQLWMRNKGNMDGLSPWSIDMPSRAAYEADMDWDFHPFARDARPQFILQYSIFREAVLETPRARGLHELIVDVDEFEHRLYQIKGKNRKHLTIFKDKKLSAGY